MGEKLDAIIFGATGFSGKLVVEEAVEILKDLQWGIAGRNKKRLEGVLRDVGSRVGKDLSHIPIILADVADEKSIENMAKNCRIVLNCCGPYRFYGEVVVKACIAAGTHHVDISGEPQYFEQMQLKYHEEAQKSGSYVVSTCAYESIPAEMGVVYTERNFPGTINSIEMFCEHSIDYKDTSSKALLHYGTWESAIYAMKNVGEMLKIKKMCNKEKTPTLKPRLYLKPFIVNPGFSDRYFIPMPVGDRDVVRRSQQLRYRLEQKRPIQFESYIGFRSLLWTVLIPILALFYAVMAQFTYTRRTLLKFPHVFSLGILSHRGPTEANMKAHYFTMTFRARGWSQGTTTNSPTNLEMLTRVSGYNPFYGLTSVALLSTAKTILSEGAKMPERGGVLPPGIAFARTGLIDELSRHQYGVKFEILSQ